MICVRQFCAVFLCVLASLFDVRAEDWPTYHGAPALTGISQTGLAPKPDVAWTFTAESSIDNTPVFDGASLFFNDRAGWVYALDRKGVELWRKRLMQPMVEGQRARKERLDAPLSVFDGRVFAGSVAGRLYALAADTGKLLWQFDTDGSILASVNRLEKDKVVLLEQGSGRLYALDAATGNQLWVTEGVERCDGAVAVHKNRVVFGSCAAALHVYDAKTGKHVRDVVAGADAQIAGGAALDEHVAFAGTRMGALICVDLFAGTMLWCNTNSSAEAFSTPALLVDRVFFGDDDGNVVALKRTTGTQIWKFVAPGSASHIVVADKKIVFCSEGAIYALDDQGILLWSKSLSDELSSPCLVGSSVVVGGDDATLYWLE